MRVRWIAAALLLATLFGCFGCAAISEVQDDVVVEEPNFIGNSSTLSGEEAKARPENLLNFAMTDADGAAQFQIVYKLGASILLQNECDRLANEIKAVTGVTVPVVHDNEGTKKYEILIGDAVRAETIDIKEEYRLGETNFVIRVVDTRVMLFAKNEQAVMTGVLFLMNVLSYRSEENAEFGVPSDTNYMYDPVENPPATVLSTDEHYVELALDTSAELKTYVRISFTGNGGWRIQTKVQQQDEYNDMGAAQRLSYSLGEADPSKLETITVSQIGEDYKLTAADGSSVVISTARFELNFYTPSGALASTVTNITTSVGGGSIEGKLEEDEAIFGTGERFNNANQRGQNIEMFTKDIWSRSDACYMAIPLLCSSRGSGVFVNLYEHMTVDLGKAVADKWTATVTGVPLDVYIFTTEKIEDVIYGYSDLTGYANMPEEWTYGMIVCAYSPDLAQKWTASITPSDDGRGEGVYEMIANMEKYDLPWTGVLAEGWGPTNSRKHEDLQELCDYVHGLGKKFLVYLRVGAANSNMKAGLDEYVNKISKFNSSYLLTQTRPDGSVSSDLPDTTAGTNNPDVGNGAKTHVYLDITNPDAVEWYFNEYWDFLTKVVGVDGVKIDFCETLPENYELNYYDETMPTSGSHHWYPTAFCAMFWDMLDKKPDSGMNYTRGGGIGSQRAPYMWAGDQARGYQSLAFQLTAVLSSGLSGVPYMSYDMSGYQYGRFSKDIAYESQVFIRGTQFTAFTICMQTHGKVRRSYQFANEDASYLYVTEIYRAYTKLHEHLTPYITELSEQASATGMPVMRHLVLGWQNDKNVYNVEDEYTFGDAFLIAPILNEGYTRDIYLPEGEWVDLNTGVEYSVGKDGLVLEEYEASIAELPTFYNKNTVSEIAPTLVEGIMDLYDYARSVAP